MSKKKKVKKQVTQRFYGVHELQDLWDEYCEIAHPPHQLITAINMALEYIDEVEDIFQNLHIPASFRACVQTVEARK